MKKIYYIICLLLIISCADDTSIFDQIAIRGGFVEFEEVPDTRFNVLRLDEAGINAVLIDPNNNIISYSLESIHEGDTINNIFEASSFPTSINLSLDDLITPFGLAREDIMVDTEFKFVATIVTPTGVYSGLTPNFINDNSVNAGGQTVNRLKELKMNNAVEFYVTFFQPPPKPIRQTSFEEPPALASLDNRYTKPGAPDESEPLPNNPGEPILNYTSQGSGVDDELGFTSEFISEDNGGFIYEEMGVTDKTTHFDFYPDGSQGFKIEDTDGRFKLTFETVAVPEGINQSGVQIRAFIREASWEPSDFHHIYANVITANGTTTQIDVAPFISGDEMEEVDGDWLTFDTGFLTGITSYQVVIESSSGNYNEDIYWDLLVIYQPDED
jgi:hypothetical protein